MADLLTKMPLQFEPLRQNRFIIRFPADLGIQEWWCESAKRPSIKQDGKEIPFDVKKGDTVLLPKYGGTEVKLGDKKLQLVREEDLLGVFEK